MKGLETNKSFHTKLKGQPSLNKRINKNADSYKSLNDFELKAIRNKQFPLRKKNSLREELGVQVRSPQNRIL